MKRHPREENVRQAKISLGKVLLKLQNELTDGEYLRVITEELTTEWSRQAKYVIREERHPGDPDMPGGLA